MLRMHHPTWMWMPIWGMMVVVSWTNAVGQDAARDDKAATPPGRWSAVTPQVDASLRGVCVVDAQTVWVSGAKGSVFRSVDAGQTWTKLVIPDSEAMDFRDIEARDAQHACVMVAGTPARIYCTQDGGETWNIACEDQREGAFFDAMEFWDADHGMAFGDAIEGRLVIATTNDGGISWTIHDADASPQVHPNEHGYAASGSCLAVAGEQFAMIGLGGTGAEDLKQCRVLVTQDRGQHWDAIVTKLAGGETAGIFSVAILDDQHVVAVGGDYLKEAVNEETATFSVDGGQTWGNVQEQRPSGYRSAVRPLTNDANPVLIATGPNGSDFSLDFGQSWHAIEGEGYHAIDFSSDGKLGWAVGSSGRMARWEAVAQ